MVGDCASSKNVSAHHENSIQCLKYLQNLNDDAKMICQKCIPLKNMYF